MSTRFRSSSRMLLGLLAIAALLTGWWLAEQPGGKEEPESEPSQITKPASAKTSLSLPAAPIASPATASGTANPKPQDKLALIPPLWEIAAWEIEKPNLAPLRPEESKASREVLARASVKPETLPDLKQVKQGQRLRMPVRFGGSVTGVVNLVMPNDEGWVRLGGNLDGGTSGSFSLAQKGNQYTGRLLRRDTATAYVVTTADDGSVAVIEKPLGAVICEAMPRPSRLGRPAAGAAAAEPDAPIGATSLSTPATPYGNVVTVPALDSLPSATHVIYLDFDGELVTDPYWNEGFSILAAPPKLSGRYMSVAQITEVWRRVSEDFAPFSISVTTILSRYTGASAGRRMRCIITPTDIAGLGAGGIAGLDSFDEGGSAFSSTVPCWTFSSDYYLPWDIAETVSHEIGHTLGLDHDGLYPDADSRHVEYYEGHGSWTPIMGGGYGRPISQWSKGEYRNANNPENDIAIIANVANGFGFRTDEALGAQPGTPLPNTGVILQAGMIADANDVEYYSLTVTAGKITLTVAPAPVGANLDLEMRLLDNTGTQVAISNPAGLGKPVINYTAAAGTYYIVLRGVGSGTAFTGYTNYGSGGAYTLTGTFPAVPDVAPTVTQHPLAQTVNQGAKVTFTVAASSNTPPSFQWTLDNGDLPGQTKSTLVITSAQRAHAGVYRCKVTNSIGTTTSDPAALVVDFKPVIIQQPPPSPAPQSGTDVTISVVAEGSPASAYQWQRNGVDIPGAISSDLLLMNVEWSNMGTYRCVVTNARGTIVSSGAVLVVQGRPAIIEEPPATMRAPLGGSFSFGIVVHSAYPVTYTWYRNNALVPGATKAVLTIPAVNAESVGTFRCEVRNKDGTTQSSNFTVLVQAPPLITNDLTSLTLRRNAKTALVVGVVGAPPLTYEWQRNGIKVGTAKSLVITGTGDADYQCIIRNSHGTATSAMEHLTVHDAPAIQTQPLAQTRALGGTASFTVVLKPASTPPFTYVWRKNGVPLPGNDNPTLNLASLATTDAGSYSCVITNDVGSITSTAAKLTLQTAPSITQHPSVATVYEDSPATFSAAATGTATLRYQWEKALLSAPASFAPITGATGSTFKIAKTLATDEALYRLKVSNTVGTAYSNVVQLTVTTITVPTVNGFQPAVGKSGHLIRVSGSGLQWTTGVSLLRANGTKAVAVFKILSDNQLLITLPVGAVTSAVTVVTKGGTATSAATITIGLSNDTNNAFADARILAATGGTATGNNTGFTAEGGEPTHCDYAAAHSAWFEWTPAVSGSYWINTKGSKFDTRVAIYSGSSVNALTTVSWNDDVITSVYTGGVWEDKVVFTGKAYAVVQAGVTYHIAVDGFTTPYPNQEGAYTLGIILISKVPE